ncbi:hypothetical protein [Actibacterium pelagium]|uniref:hypothetical protein n=1 Tax=Actibacterium pelagium TaxID=2029103 RepID=UPI001178692D|nr:hypothetical protein [Actibacterium pelagium]
MLAFLALIGLQNSVPDAPTYEQMRTIQRVANTIIHGSFMGLIVATAWAAVAWHRHRLVGENVLGIFPRFQLSAVYGYAWRILMLILLCAIFVLIPALVVGIVIGVNHIVVGNFKPALHSGAVHVAFTFLVTTVFTSMFLRYAMILPAKAVGETITLSESWRRTSDRRFSIIGIAVFYSAATLLYGYLSITASVFVQLSQIPALAYVQDIFFLFVQWILLMLSVSILTTLYAESRPVLRLKM